MKGNDFVKLREMLSRIKLNAGVLDVKRKTISEKATHYIFYHDESLLEKVKPQYGLENFVFVDLNKIPIPDDLKVKDLDENQNRALFSEYLGILSIKPSAKIVGLFTYSIPLKFSQDYVDGGADANIFLPKIKFEDLVGKKFNEDNIYGAEFSSYDWDYPGVEIIQDVDKNVKLHIKPIDDNKKGPFKGSIIIEREVFLEFQKWFFEATKYLLNKYGWTCNLKPGAFSNNGGVLGVREKSDFDLKIRNFGHIQERLMAYYFGRKFSERDRIKLGKYLNDEKFNLIVQYFVSSNKDRQKEINECLEKNCLNNHIKKIFLLVEKQYEEKLLNNPKIKQIVIGRRLKFNDAFDFANNNLKDENCILSNADIYFDQTIVKAYDYNLNNNFLVLTRHNHFADGRDQLMLGPPKYNQYKIQKEFDGEGGYIEWGSQDAWIFKANIPNKLIKEANFELGQLHCDSHFAWILKTNGFKTLNPCFEIIARHLHNVPSGITRENIEEHSKKQIMGIKYPINPDGSSTPADRTWIQGDDPGNKIKMYSLFTPSHRVLLERFFLPSIKDDYFLVLKEFEQECETGDFHSDGWMKTMTKKIQLVIDAIKENPGKIFIHSDVDIQFFGKTKNLILDVMEDKDILFLRDSPKSNYIGGNGSIFCAGFFVCRGSERTLKFFQDVLKTIPEKNIDDQAIINYLIKNSGEYSDLNFDYLPDNFFSPGLKNGYGKWNWRPGEKLEIPENIVMHHGNWTVGLENKKAQMSYVRETVFRKRGFI